MSALVDKLRSEVAKAEQEAQRTFKEFQDFKTEATKEKPADAIIGNTELFNSINEKHREHTAAAQKADEYRDQLISLLTWEGAEPAPQDLGTRGKDVEATRRSKIWTPDAEVWAKTFLESDTYKNLVKSGRLQQSGIKIDTDPVEVMKRLELKAMLKTLVTGAGATQGDVLILPDRQGIVDLPRTPLVVTDMIAIGETDSDQVEYVEMLTRTNNAAERPEATTVGDTAADAPESGFTIGLNTSNVRELKHFIPATRTAIADAGQLRTIIDQELLDGLRERVDVQILTGNGTAPNLRGILNTAGILTQALGADDRASAIHKAITQILLQNFVPDAILMHPNDWQEIRLLKDANGNFIFGPPSAVGTQVMWGYPVRLSPRITEGTALVGAFRRGATLWLRQGAVISATDSHSDWFLRGIIAILATMRAAFAVQRPKCFCTVTGV